MSEPFGFLNIDKPLYQTSHDIVARLRRGLHVDKIGHAGTLDPLATGVLILCVGGATRLSEYVMASTKVYCAEILLGVTTTTDDAEGEVIARQSADLISRDDVERVLPSFLGEIDQLPPLYSAIKQGGRKLYELARQGAAVERQPRRVRIIDLEITHWKPPEFALLVTCSAGTYIRSLARDLGEALGVGASLYGLTRTVSGSFRLQHALPPDTLVNDPNWRRHLVSPRGALAHWPSLTIDMDAAAELRYGRPLPGADQSDGSLVLAYGHDDALIAILRAEASLWKPHKVFVSS